MSDLQLDNQQVWDRLLDLLYDCDEKVTDVEMDILLQEAGIDMLPAFRRLHEIIDQEKARQELALASDTRASIMDRLRNVVGPTLGDLRTEVRGFIDRVFSGPEQVAHYHKLEKAATDEDLQSLMDDLSRLAALQQSKDTDEAKTK